MPPALASRSPTCCRFCGCICSDSLQVIITTDINCFSIIAEWRCAFLCRSSARHRATRYRPLVKTFLLQSIVCSLCFAQLSPPHVAPDPGSPPCLPHRHRHRHPGPPAGRQHCAAALALRHVHVCPHADGACRESPTEPLPPFCLCVLIRMFIPDSRQSV